MATIPFSADTDRGEARFFFTMACVMAASIVGGFAFNLAMGISSFDVPVMVHIHAFVMFGWVALYLTQNAMIFTDNVAIHRKLGWLAVIWLPMMLVLGCLMTRWSIQQHGVPPFLEVNEFLFSNPALLLLSIGLFAWAITVRANTGWHRHGHDYVVVPLMDGKVKLVTKDGESFAEMKAGAPYFRGEGVEHDVINANDGEYAFIEIELK